MDLVLNDKTLWKNEGFWFYFDGSCHDQNLGSPWAQASSQQVGGVVPF